MSKRPAVLPTLLRDTDVRQADVVVTMGCGDECPFYPGERYEDWVLDDPPASRSRSSAASVTRSAAESRGSCRSSLRSGDASYAVGPGAGGHDDQPGPA